MLNNLLFRFQSLMLHAFCIIASWVPIWRRVHPLVGSFSIPRQAVSFLNNVCRTDDPCITSKRLYTENVVLEVNISVSFWTQVLCKTPSATVFGEKIYLLIIKCQRNLFELINVYLSFNFRNIRSFKPGVQCSVHIFLELALLVSEPRNVSCDIPPFEPSVRS